MNGCISHCTARSLAFAAGFALAAASVSAESTPASDGKVGLTGTNPVLIKTAAEKAAATTQKTPAWVLDNPGMIFNKDGRPTGFNFAAAGIDTTEAQIQLDGLRDAALFKVQDCQPDIIVSIFFMGGSSILTTLDSPIRLLENFYPGFPETSPGAGNGTVFGSPLEIVQFQFTAFYISWFADLALTPQSEADTVEIGDDDPAITGLPVLDVTTSGTACGGVGYGVPDTFVTLDDYNYDEDGTTPCLGAPAASGIQKTPGTNEAFVENVKWTLRYYVDSGDANPDLPIADPLLAPGDSSADLVAKFEFIPTQYATDAIAAATGKEVPDPSAGTMVVIHDKNGFPGFNIFGFGITGDTHTDFEHAPVAVAAGDCMWVEILPEYSPTYPAFSMWLTGLGGDGWIWDDFTGDGLGPGEEEENALGFCVDINTVDPDGAGPLLAPPGASGNGDEGQDLGNVIICTNNPCALTPQPNDDCVDAFTLTLGIEAPAIVSNTVCSSSLLEGEASTFTEVTNEGGSQLDVPQGNPALWFLVSSPAGNDLTASMCSVNTTGTTANARGNWGLGVYCGTCTKQFPVAWDAASNATNAGCTIPFSVDPLDPSVNWTFPEVTWATSPGTVYQVLVYAILSGGDIGLTVFEEVAATGASAIQCSPCTLDTAGFVADIVEPEDVNSTAGVCVDITSGLAYQVWEDTTRVNNACGPTSDLTQAQADAFHQRFTPLTGSFTDAQIFGTTGPGGTTDPGSPLPTPMVAAPLTVNVQGTAAAQPVINNINDFDDADNYGFQVAVPTMVRFEVAANFAVQSFIGTYRFKDDGLGGPPDPALGPKCGTFGTLTDGARSGRCQPFVSQSALALPGLFHTARVFHVSFNQAIFCGPENDYIGTITLTDCTGPALPVGAIHEADLACDPAPGNNLNAGCDFVTAAGELEAYDNLSLGAVAWGELGHDAFQNIDTDWYTFTAPASGNVDITIDAGQDLFGQVYDFPILDCDFTGAQFLGSFTVGTRQDAGTGVCSTGPVIALTTLVGGQQYAIQLGTGDQGLVFFSATGRPCGTGINSYTLTVTEPSPPGACLGGFNALAGDQYSGCRDANQADCSAAGGVFQGGGTCAAPLVPLCITDQTTNNTNPGDALSGIPDGNVNGADLSFYVEAWLGGSSRADMTTTNTNPGDPACGAKDGATNGADLSWYVELWLSTSAGGACTACI